MTETMGQIIRRLRRERNLTQEELAEQLNLSAPAISKWENDTSMPDISQVVPLANLFGVPTDVLFGRCGTVSEDEANARLAEIFRMCDRCPDGEEAPMALVILDQYREAMRLYPNNSTILVNAMAFAEMVLSCNERELAALIGQEGIERLTQEVIRWAELVIKYSASLDDVLSAKRRLIDIHARRKQWEEAFALAETFPREAGDLRGVRLAALYAAADDAGNARAQRCHNVRELADALGHQAAMLGNLYRQEGKYEDALYCYTFLREMVEALYRDEPYRPPFVYDHYPMYRFPAECLVKLGREEEAVGLLEDGVRFILAQAEDYNKKQALAVPLLRDCSFGYGFDGDAVYGDVPAKLEKFIRGGDLAQLAENPRYQALMARVDALKSV